MTDTPEIIIPPMKPGVDHPQHTAPMRQVVATNAGVAVKDVIPPDETAEEIINDAQTSFLKSVASLEAKSTGLQEPDSGEIGNIMETVKAFIPGGDDTSRTGPAKEPYDLETERREKMVPVEEVV